MSQETDAINESAKAVQAVAKATNSAIDASVQFGGFMSRFISGPLEHAVGIFEDKLRYMRWERQQRLMKRAEEFMAAQGLPTPTKAIPLKLAIPLFWAASVKDDDYLQDLWAMLLVNGSNADSGIDLKRAHIDILERLCPPEARILEKIYSLPFNHTQHKGVATANLPESASMDDETNPASQEPNAEVKLALANLARLGCISLDRSWGGGELFGSVNPTVMGKSFVEACTPRVE